MPIQIREEFDPPTVKSHGHAYGAIDAAPIIPAGSMVAQIQGKREFGMPQRQGRRGNEHRTDNADQQAGGKAGYGR